MRRLHRIVVATLILSLAGAYFFGIGRADERVRPQDLRCVGLHFVPPPAQGMGAAAATRPSPPDPTDTLWAYPAMMKRRSGLERFVRNAPPAVRRTAWFGSFHDDAGRVDSLARALYAAPLEDSRLVAVCVNVPGPTADVLTVTQAFVDDFLGEIRKAEERDWASYLAGLDRRVQTLKAQLAACDASMASFTDLDCAWGVRLQRDRLRAALIAAQDDYEVMAYGCGSNESGRIRWSLRPFLTGPGGLNPKSSWACWAW